MAIYANNKRANTSDSAKFTDSNLAAWSSFPDAAFSSSTETIWIYPGFFSSHGSVDLQVTKVA